MSSSSSSEELVDVCCTVLAEARSDTDKLAALLYATPCIQSEHRNAQSHVRLFKSISATFLHRMLSGRLDVPELNEGSYQKVALDIITGFCIHTEIAKDSDVLKMIPDMFGLLRNYENPKEILEGVVQFFTYIIEQEEGRKALLSQKAINEFAWMYSHLKSEQALDFIDILLKNDAVDKDYSCFNFLMNSLSEEFAKNHTEKKFTICHHLLRVLSLEHSVDSSIANQKWPSLILKGLKDILTSRIDDMQRVPALKLASTMIERYGMEWAVEDKTSPHKRQFQLLLVHLSSIECRMQMEDQTLPSIMKNADLIIACFAIMEKAVQDLLGENLEMREKDQILQAYSDAAAAVVSTTTAAFSLEETMPQHNIFFFAMIEFLCSGFAYDVLTLNPEVYECIPFIIKMAKKSFREYVKWYDENKDEASPKDEAPIDLFGFMIPAFQHFAAQEDGQKIIIDEMDTILEHVDFSWKVVEPAAMESATGMKGSNLSHSARSSLSLLVKITELMTDTILIKPETVKAVPQFAELFSKVAAMLPVLENSSVFNPLLSTASILGLVLIKHLSVPEEDVRIEVVLRGSAKFLKTYKNKVSSADASVFQVGDNIQFWVNIREMWLLGVHLLGRLHKEMPWIRAYIENFCPELLPDIDLAEDIHKLSISEKKV